MCMPELPDVEGFRHVFAEHAVGHRLEKIDVCDEQVIRGLSATDFTRRLRGVSFAEPIRHGKWLKAPVAGREGGPVLLLHFGMTGALEWCSGNSERRPHDRVIFEFAAGELRYRDMRKLQGLRLVTDVGRALGDIGPDALTVSREDFAAAFAGLRRQVKTALTDQALLAGLGNLLADEILWRSRINPERPCDRLSESDTAALHTRMRAVLRQSVRDERVPPRRNWLTGHRDDRPGVCPRCRTELRRGRVGGRGTVWCPRCQAD